MKNFNLNTIIQVLLISGTSIIVAFLYMNHYYFSASFLAFVLILQIVLLLKYIGKTNQYIKQFLEGIRYNDFSGNFSTEGLGSSFDELGKTFDNVIKDFQNIRSEKEEQYQILQNIIHHINVGLLAYKDDGEIILHNTQFRHFFNLPVAENINEHAKYHPEIPGILRQLKMKKKLLFKRVQEEDILQLAVFRTEFKLKGENLTLLSVYDIQPELDEKEMEAWQKLIRVLTHEIMNSITPISSLSATLKHMVQNSESMHAHQLDIKDALNSIERRSSGLIDFVEKYRSLTKIPKPDFKIIPLQAFLERCLKLISEDCSVQNVSIVTEISDSNIEIVADENQIEQVLINLIKNACQALVQVAQPQIRVRALINNHGKAEIQIIDNGSGILPEVMDKIFIPFYSTKQDGSGIGLSISRQIMRLHGGSIFVNSEPGNTLFCLRFK